MKASIVINNSIASRLLIILYLAGLQLLLVMPSAFADAQISSGVELTSDLSIDTAFQWRLKNVEMKNY